MPCRRRHARDADAAVPKKRCKRSSRGPMQVADGAQGRWKRRRGTMREEVATDEAWNEDEEVTE